MQNIQGAGNISSESMVAVTSSVASIKDGVCQQDSGLEISESLWVKKEVGQLRTETAKLQTHMMALTKQVEDQRAMIEEKDAKLEATIGKCKIFEERSSLLASKVEETLKEKEKLENELKLRDEEMEDLKMKNVEMKKKVLEIEGLEEENVLLKKENAQMKEELLQKDKERQANEATYESVVNAMKTKHEEDLGKVNKENQMLMAKLAELQKQVDIQKVEMKENAEELKTTMQKCKIFEDKTSQLTSQVQEATKVKENLQKALSLREDQMEDLITKNMKLLMMVKEEHKAEMKQQLLKIFGLEKEIITLRKENTQVKEEFVENSHQQQARKAAHESVINALKIKHEEDLGKVSKKSDFLMEELDDLKKQVDGQKAIIDKNTKELNLSIENCKIFADQSSVLISKVYESSKGKEKLGNELKLREEQLEDLKIKNMEAAKKTQEEHGAEVRKKVLEIEGLEKNLAMLKRTNAQVTEALKKSNHEMHARETAHNLVVKAMKVRSDEDLEKVNRRNKTLMAEVNNLQKQVEGQKAIFAENIKELKTSKEKCKELAIEKSALALQLENAGKVRKGLEKEVDEKDKKLGEKEVLFEEEIKQMKIAHSVNMTKKVLKIERLQKEVTKYHRDQTEKKKELMEMELKLRAKQVANDAIIAAMEITCKAETEKYEKEIKELKRKVSDEERLKESHIGEQKLMIIELAELKEELHDLKIIRERYRKERHRLSSKIDELIIENGEVYKNLLEEREDKEISDESFIATISGLDKECARLEDCNSKLEKELGIFKEQLVIEENTVMDLEREVEQLLAKKSKKRGIRKLLCC